MKKTSVTGMVLEHYAAPPWAVLADFDIGGSTLKTHHTDWLHDVLIPAMKAKSHRKGTWHIRLIGRASRSGADEFNAKLSEARLQEAKRYIEASIKTTNVNWETAPLGESNPKDPKLYENDLDRSVEVVAMFFPTPTPKLHPRRRPNLIPRYIPWKRPMPKKVTNFIVRAKKVQIDIVQGGIEFPGGLLVGPGHAFVKMLIEIQEVGTIDKALYEFDGSGTGGVLSGSISPSKGTPKPNIKKWSQTYEDGSSHNMLTTTPVDAEDFESNGSLFKNAFGSSFAFGGPFWSDKHQKISDFDLGKPMKDSFLTLGECSVTGDLELVTSLPSWAE